MAISVFETFFIRKSATWTRFFETRIITLIFKSFLYFTQKNAAMMEKQRKLEELRSTWQPPKRESDSESESDDDMIQDDDNDR